MVQHCERCLSGAVIDTGLPGKKKIYIYIYIYKKHANHVQHVEFKNVGRCCIEMLDPFVRILKNYPQTVCRQERVTLEQECRPGDTSYHNTIIRMYFCLLIDRERRKPRYSVRSLKIDFMNLKKGQDNSLSLSVVRTKHFNRDILNTQRDSIKSQYLRERLSVQDGEAGLEKPILSKLLNDSIQGNIVSG